MDHSFLAIKVTTNNGPDYTNQYKLAQAHSLFQHQKFVMLNLAVKKAYTNLSTSNGLRDFADGLKNVASMASGLHSLDPRTRYVLHSQKNGPHRDLPQIGNKIHRAHGTQLSPGSLHHKLREAQQPICSPICHCADWVEDVIYLICKLADCSWKRQLDQNAQWFWFQCIHRLSITSCQATSTSSLLDQKSNPLQLKTPCQ
jgi:hypothetical protein